MIGVVTGLEAEARIARRWGVPVEVGGGTAEGAARAAEVLAARPGIAGLVSFGLAGGLNPALRAGALLVPTRILGDGAAWATDPALNARLGGGTLYTLLGDGAVLATVAAKAAAHAAGADAVDLESAAVARAAARHGIGCAALRAICDAADRTLPPVALAALDAAGRIAPGQVAASLLRQPGQLAGLLGLARDAARARQALAGRVRTVTLAGADSADQPG